MSVLARIRRGLAERDKPMDRHYTPVGSGRSVTVRHDWTCPHCGSEFRHTFRYEPPFGYAICGIVCHTCEKLVPQAVDVGAVDR